MKYDLNNKYKAQLAKEYLDQLIIKGCMAEVKELKLKRSIDQNSLYWVWMACIQEQTGIDKNEAHLLYRGMLLSRGDEYIEEIIRPDLWSKLKRMISEFSFFKGLDQIIDVISYSTTELETDVFSKYLGNIQKHARANMGVILLNLEDKHFEDFYRVYGFL